MALTAAEQAEMDSLQKDVGHLAPQQSSGGLTPAEQAEMRQLQGEVGHLANPNQNAPGEAQTALEHGANAMTLGYLPQLQAAAEPLTTKIGNLVTGQNVESDSYTAARDKNAARISAEAEANPKTALGANIGGSVVGALATPGAGLGLGVSKGLLSAAAKGALQGGIQGAVQNPGETPGEVSPLQFGERAKNALTGAAVGAVTGGATEAARKGIGALAGLGSKLSRTAENAAFKSSGAMLKDFRVAGDKAGRGVQDLGRFMLDNGLVAAGDTVEDVAKKSAAYNQLAGQNLSGVYKKALSAIENPDIEKAMPGFNPVKDKAELMKHIENTLGDSTEATAAMGKVEGYVDQLAKKYGDKTLDPRLQNDIKGEIDRAINYARNPLSKEPASEQGYSAARQFLAKKIDQSVDYLGKQVGDEGLAKELKAANQQYGLSKQINTIAEDRISRISANSRSSLTDTIAGGAGGVAGTVAGAAMGGGDHDARSMSEGALAGGLLAGAANHYGKKYGAGILADTTNRMAPAAGLIAPVGRLSGLVPRNDIMVRAAVNSKRKGLVNDNQ